MRFFAPSRCGCLLGYLVPLFGAQSLSADNSAYLATLAPQGHGMWIFAVLTSFGVEFLASSLLYHPEGVLHGV
ncbi:MAG: hypothetical protein WAR21_01660 [Candidatus Acidiferrales bacterium]